MKTENLQLTQALVQSLFDYCPDTGVVTHRIDKHKAKAGTRAGSTHKSKARYLRVQGTKQLEHRIIWLYVYGELPEHEVDHINQDRSDNRLCNLRAVTHAQNMRNKPRYVNNTSGTAGVSVDRRCNKYRAYINVAGKHTGLGYYDSLEEAVAARHAALKAGGDYHANHGN